MIQLYRARRKALDEIEGTHGKSYSKLRMYANEIRKSNPGSIAVIECDRLTVDSNPMFRRMFISFERVVKVAFAVVESEGRNNWSFFLNNLITIIGSDTNHRPLSLMSDMQKVKAKAGVMVGVKAWLKEGVKVGVKEGVKVGVKEGGLQLV
ncbi:hypothetical protein F0562_003613 [Nyssa sinensis]|uniref:Uncharacterized protein n=1 Tax=Nyssa sinensis TaxID=561372 RepID=A0A5J5BWG1_9ASTE|nr:hypothetical protein F0562_003613 [Nyssa sinensis]